MITAEEGVEEEQDYPDDDEGEADKLAEPPSEIGPDFGPEAHKETLTHKVSLEHHLHSG